MQESGTGMLDPGSHREATAFFVVGLFSTEVQHKFHERSQKAIQKENGGQAPLGLLAAGKRGGFEGLVLMSRVGPAPAKAGRVTGANLCLGRLSIGPPGPRPN